MLKRIATEQNANSANLSPSTEINNLNNDCLRHIFSYLNIKDRMRIQRVCKRWQQLSNVLWEYVTKLTIDHSTDAGIKRILIFAGRSLISIRFNMRNKLLTIPRLKAIKNSCPNLRRLDVSGITVTRKAADHLGNHFENITHFTIGQTWHGCEESLAKFFAKNCLMTVKFINTHNLNGLCLQGLRTYYIENVTFERCSGFSLQDVERVLRKLSNLQSLVICNLSILIRSIDSLIQILPQTNLLTRLEVTDYENLISDQMIHVENFALLTNLKEIYLHGNAVVHNDCLNILSQNCIHISKAYLSGSHRLTDDGLINFVNKLSSLVELRLYGLHGIEAGCFARMYCTSLKVISCEGFSQLTNDSMKALFAASENLVLLEMKNIIKVKFDELVEEVYEIYNQRNSHEHVKVQIIFGKHMQIATLVPPQ